MGYEIGRFVSEIDDEFLCSICTMVLENPMQSPCEHIFCDDCIKEWLTVQATCPVDSCSLALDDMKPTPRYFRNLLEKFEIKCTFEPKGCQTIVPLAQLQDHLTDCAFNPNTEVICDKGCNIKITRGEYEAANCFTHLANRQQEHFNNITRRQEDEIRKLIDEAGRQREEFLKLNDELSGVRCHSEHVISRQQEEIEKLSNEVNRHREEIAKLNNELDRESCIQQSCNIAESVPSTAMRGILHLDVVCVEKIFKFLKPLVFCTLRQSCTQLRDFVDGHFHSLYYVREQWLDLRSENVGTVNRILQNFGKHVRYLKVLDESRGRNLLLNVILTNCGTTLKGLSLKDAQLCEIDMEKFAGVFDNLDILELPGCDGDEKTMKQFLLGPKYTNLTTLKVDNKVAGYEILRKFFMTKRKITKLTGCYIRGDLLPLIVMNAPAIEELFIDLYTDIDSKDLISLVKLEKLRRLETFSLFYYQTVIMALTKQLSANNQLEILGLQQFEFTNESCDALSKLTNLKELRLWNARCTLNDSKPMEMLGRKLSKLESLMLMDCSDFPYRNFLASACKSDKFRKFYVGTWEISSFFQQTVKDFTEGIGDRCFVAGDPLCIYLHETMFKFMEQSLTRDNLQSIEKFGNIKILRAMDDVFEVGC